MKRPLAATMLLLLSGCSEGGEPGTTSLDPDLPMVERCLVRLHGKGGKGAEPLYLADGTRVISPEGNGSGWGGREWRYFPEARFEDARELVQEASAGCRRVIINGFSNGGAFAAKLYCSGETLGGRLVGVVVDDPVPDHAADACAPASGIDLTLYWTGALDASSKPGTRCSAIGWTCEGSETIGIEAFAESMGVSWIESPFREHQWYLDAPELMDWD